jgi:hypothetical protein
MVVRDCTHLGVWAFALSEEGMPIPFGSAIGKGWLLLIIARSGVWALKFPAFLGNYGSVHSEQEPNESKQMAIENKMVNTADKARFIRTGALNYAITNSLSIDSRIPLIELGRLLTTSSLYDLDV